jgi:imidazoleglycerol phosphate synthase glutamine amidotransferase subunit HisH
MSMPILSERIQTALEELGTECPLEEVMNLCPEITWNQLFLTIDHLSRTGQVRIRLDADRTYWVQSYYHQRIERTHDWPIDSQAFEHEYELSFS